MNRDIEIQKNIPIPIGKAYKGKWKEVARVIQSGDSFFVDSRAKVESARNALRLAGKDGISRVEGSGFRVWCVKEMK